MADVLIDTVLDSIKLIPFLFLTYLVMEILEHKTGEKSKKRIQKAGNFGPIWGGLLGVIPQCGFSTVAANLYSGGVITVGTMLAVFLSTSDEMLPIMISESVSPYTVMKILFVKVIIAIISGLIAEFVYLKLLKNHEKGIHIHEMCTDENCHCEDGIVVSSVKHTLKIIAYIFLVTLVLNVVIQAIGEDTIGTVLSGKPWIEIIIAGILGLIPNCASSVIITEIYLLGMISPGAMIAGLMANAGVGILVLFKMNHNRTQNMKIVGVLYLISIFWGIVLEIAGISF